MELTTKKRLAKEYLIFMSCIVLSIVFYGGTYLHDKYIDYKIDVLNEKIREDHASQFFDNIEKVEILLRDFYNKYNKEKIGKLTRGEIITIIISYERRYKPLISDIYFKEKIPVDNNTIQKLLCKYKLTTVYDLKHLYEFVSKEYNIGDDFKDFISNMATQELRKRFYNKMSELGYVFGDYNEYENNVGYIINKYSFGGAPDLYKLPEVSGEKSIKDKRIGIDDRVVYSFICLLILLTISFPLRYIVYSITWSIHKIK